VTAYEVVLDALRCNGKQVVERGEKAQAQCPAHADNTPSLSIGRRNDGKGVVLYCQTGGCDYRDVLQAIGLTDQDLFDDKGLRDALKPNQEYRYKDGRVKHRRKTPDGKKMWQTGNMSDPSLFGVEHLTVGDQTVYLCEGEKAVLVLRALGCAAVATGGAQRSCDMKPLKGRDVIAVVDRDAGGVKWAERMRSELSGVARSVMLFQSKVDLEKADVVEHLVMGFALTDLEPFQPETSSADTTDDDDIPLPPEPPLDGPAREQHDSEPDAGHDR